MAAIVIHSYFINVYVLIYLQKGGFKDCWDVNTNPGHTWDSKNPRCKGWYVLVKINIIFYFNKINIMLLCGRLETDDCRIDYIFYKGFECSSSKVVLHEHIRGYYIYIYILL